MCWAVGGSLDSGLIRSVYNVWAAGLVVGGQSVSAQEHQPVIAL